VIRPPRKDLQTALLSSAKEIDFLTWVEHSAIEDKLEMKNAAMSSVGPAVG
jgi:hypothetical protein